MPHTLLCFALLIVAVTPQAPASVIGEAGALVPPWRGTTVADLHAEYRNIFTHGNRNAASHLWASFLLDRAPQLTLETLETLFTGFCAVSGSPVHASDYKRYRLTLPRVGPRDASRAPRPAAASGFMYYCCWPCVCDTQDFLRVDTKTIAVRAAAGGTENVTRAFAVLGDPCARPDALHARFVQPFGRGETTLAREAPMVTCGADGRLEGATLSDHGYVIVSMFFDAHDADARDVVGAKGFDADRAVVTTDARPGRMTTRDGVAFQDEAEFGTSCDERAANGYNSGMGEIFRKVAAITPIVIPQEQAAEKGRALPIVAADEYNPTCES